MPQFSETNINGELLAPPSAGRFASRGSRAEMEKFASAGMLPSEVVEGLHKGGLRLADVTHYTVKLVKGEKTVKMFESQDIEEDGLRSISHGKLPHQQAMMLSGIWVLAGVAQAANIQATDEELKTTDFKSISAMPQICNGSLELKVNKTQIIPSTSCRMFVTDNNHNWSLGYYKLDNPRLILPQFPIEAQFSLPTTTGLDPSAAIFLGLHGTVTTP